MAVMFQIKVFWVVTPCRIVVGYLHFRGPSPPDPATALFRANLQHPPHYSLSTPNLNLY